MAQRDNFDLTNLEKLFYQVKEYRTCEYFKKILDICKKFKHLAPYNSMLINMQKPGAKYVLHESEWMEKFNRHIKPNAQPLIILVPFGPVDFLFEISDTEKNDPLSMSDKDILEAIARPYKTPSEVKDEDLKNLINRCAFHGITFDMTMNAGAAYAADIRLLDIPLYSMNVEIKKNHFMDLLAPYLISVNKNASSNGERFTHIIHELGHFFCRHLPSPKGWDKWEVRVISKEAEEFEAESVARLICDRLNIQNTSERYLSGYLEKEQIPSDVSIQAIFNAVNEVWKLCGQQFYCKDGFLYKKDRQFKLFFDNWTKKEADII